MKPFYLQVEFQFRNMLLVPLPSYNLCLVKIYTAVRSSKWSPGRFPRALRTRQPLASAWAGSEEWVMGFFRSQPLPTSLHVIFVIFAADNRPLPLKREVGEAWLNALQFHRAHNSTFEYGDIREDGRDVWQHRKRRKSAMKRWLKPCWS